jgi:transposase
MPLTVAVDVSPRDREVLQSWLRAPSLRAGLVQRARIVLLAADGVAVKDIVARVGVSKPTVIGWKKRYVAEGLGGLEDRPKPGRRRVVDEAAVVSATLEPPPQRLGVTHWSTRLLGAELGISHVWVGKIWKRWGLQPWRAETFKFSTDPQLEAKVRDVVGLYLNPPDKTIVLCVDEKSQVQALDRTAPTLPMRLGIPEKQTHDYVRHGTTTLFAALNIATGTVTARCQPRHRHQEFLRFLKQVARAYPDRELHLVMDNYAAHKRVEIRDWLAANPRVQVHFTPTSASWMNLVEVWFGIIERQAIHRGSYRSVTDLTRAIRAFIDGWNQRAHPFVWTKTAEQILAKADRKKTSDAPH